MNTILSPSFTQREYKWSEFKTVKTTKTLNIQYEESEDKYLIWGYDGPEILFCYVYKSDVPQSVIDSGYTQSQNDTDKNDFESNFKSSSNSFLVEKDINGSVFGRLKVVPTGWTYCAYGIIVTTSKYSGALEVFKDNVADSAINCTHKIYNGSDAEITSTLNELTAVKTVITIEPTYDIYVISGRVAQSTARILMDVIVVPDISAESGGSKYFAQNLNIKKFSNLITDGKAPKLLSYNATYHTNKFKFVFYYPMTTVEEISVIIEAYRA